jgi:hypothetical protein
MEENLPITLSHMAIHSSRFLRKMDHLIEEMDRKDAVVINIDIMFITLLVVHFWPELAQAHWAWYVVAVVTSEIYLYQKLHKINHPKHTTDPTKTTTPTA